jgi:hypothetical protein
MMRILGSGRLEARTAFGFVRNTAPDPRSQRAVCFSETPLHLLGRIARRRSEYGIVFHKDFILRAGGNPILYAYGDGPVALAVQQLVTATAGDASAPIWRLTPFVDRPGRYGTTTYFYEWEREWRTPGDVAFQTTDVAFLIIPEALHEDARDFFLNARREHLGPCYDCPYIDAHWPLARVAPLLSNA